MIFELLAQAHISELQAKLSNPHINPAFEPLEF